MESATKSPEAGHPSDSLQDAMLVRGRLLEGRVEDQQHAAWASGTREGGKRQDREFPVPLVLVKQQMFPLGGLGVSGQVSGRPLLRLREAAPGLSRLLRCPTLASLTRGPPCSLPRPADAASRPITGCPVLGMRGGVRPRDLASAPLCQGPVSECGHPEVLGF